MSRKPWRCCCTLCVLFVVKDPDRHAVLRKRQTSFFESLRQRDSLAGAFVSTQRNDRSSSPRQCCCYPEERNVFSPFSVSKNCVITSRTKRIEKKKRGTGVILEKHAIFMAYSCSVQAQSYFFLSLIPSVCASTFCPAAKGARSLMCFPESYIMSIFSQEKGNKFSIYVYSCPFMQSNNSNALALSFSPPCNLQTAIDVNISTCFIILKNNNRLLVKTLCTDWQSHCPHHIIIINPTHDNDNACLLALSLTHIFLPKKQCGSIFAQPFLCIVFYQIICVLVVVINEPDSSSNPNSFKKIY